MESEWVIFGVKNDYTIDWEMMEKRKDIAFAILGCGAFISYLYIIGCLVKHLGFLIFLQKDKNSCIEDGNQSEDEGR